MKRTSRDIRVANRFGVLRHILAGPAVSRQEIAVQTALSFATVSNLVGELLAMGLLEEVGFQDSGGGRPRGLVAMNPGGGFLIGLDVAETYVHAELFDAALTVLSTAEEQLHPDENRPDQVVEHIVSAIGAVMTDGEVEADRVLGIGVSVPGQVDPEGGVSVFAPNWDWHDVPMRGMLRSRLAMPLYLDNPLRASAVAELWFGAGRGHDDVVVLTLAGDRRGALPGRDQQLGGVGPHHVGPRRAAVPLRRQGLRRDLRRRPGDHGAPAGVGADEPDAAPR